MFDLQGIYFQDTVRVSFVEPVIMLRLRNVRTASVSSVEVNVVPVPFMADGTDTLAAIPDRLQYGDVHSVTIDYTGGLSATVVDIAPLLAPEDSTHKVSAAARIFRVRGEDFSDVASVIVNGLSQAFTVLSSIELLCKIPSKDSTLNSLDVITNSKSITRTSLFSYQLGDVYRRVGGTQKLVMQFLKCLLTTAGSDHYDAKAPAGNLQTWRTRVVSGDNPQSMAALVTSDIITCGVRFSALQIGLNIPTEEKLAYVNVLNVSPDERNPGNMNVGIRLVTQAGTQSQFGLLLGTAQEFASNLTNITG